MSNEPKAPHFMSYEDWIKKHPEEAEPDPKCEHCKGTGIFKDDCPDCEGEGVCSNCGHECDTCDGEGKTEETCACCDARAVYTAIRVHEEVAWNANRMSTAEGI